MIQNDGVCFQVIIHQLKLMEDGAAGDLGAPVQLKQGKNKDQDGATTQRRSMEGMTAMVQSIMKKIVLVHHSLRYTFQ